ncbi:MAG: lipoprotein signal peptidase [Bacteroidales bacterium]|nr:lipoprotein signal peptidase [Bacteroidales bacterium]MCF8389119.1 lipoprotein signal peptidase [Bacteroidales bacterium]
MSITKKSILIIVAVLIVDQVLKIIVKTNMLLYQDIHVLGNWFIIKFIENDGMAFGFDLPGNYGKLSLTIFRIIALIGISFYLKHLIKIKSPTGLIVAISLIFAGATGNIIDSVFYGNIFSESTPFAAATMFPKGGGYGSFMHGHVVDMFYFPILRGYYPDWIPWKGGDAFEFFRPIFNIADSSITIGVLSILIFQKRFFAEAEEVPEASVADSE